MEERRKQQRKKATKEIKFKEEYLKLQSSGMSTINERVLSIDKEVMTEALHHKGYTMIKSFLSLQECIELRETFDEPNAFRKTIVMERYRFGKGVYKYYRYPLNNIINGIRQELYPLLVPAANQWMNQLSMDTQFPATWPELHKLCSDNDQTLPTVLILQYGEGGYNTLHQDLYGKIFFPFQLVICLSEPGKDFTGGEFVITEQVPRAQSKAKVLNPGLGDMIIFTTNFRPVKGSRGYYKANMKHGVSEISTGTRSTLGIIFHDALT